MSFEKLERALIERYQQKRTEVLRLDLRRSKEPLCDLGKTRTHAEILTSKIEVLRAELKELLWMRDILSLAREQELPND